MTFKTVILRNQVNIVSTHRFLYIAENAALFTLIKSWNPVKWTIIYERKTLWLDYYLSKTWSDRTAPVLCNCSLCRTMRDCNNKQIRCIIDIAAGL
jgi:hypothetical protein